MILISPSETEPFHNIATEEFLLKNASDNLIMLWQNSPSIIVGKHQNTFAEVNLDFLKNNEIPVIRRISGGGTVYHDFGNINYTLITTEENPEKRIDFRKFTEPIIIFLKQLGIEATFEGKNNLKVKGKKISGNSAHVMKNRTMHHGTLLFNTNLENLENAIKPPTLKITDTAVKSVRAHVTNIVDELNIKLHREEFKNQFQQFLINFYQVKYIYPFSEHEKMQIEKLSHEKYRTWEWNFGYSPTYEVDNQITVRNITADSHFQVKKGVIDEINIRFLNNNKLSNTLNSRLSGVRHDKESITQNLTEINHIFEKNNLQINEIMPLFF